MNILLLTKHFQDGLTALHYAADNGKTDIANLLIDCGVYINVQDTVIE